jgi:class 3 adenylate cyclase
MAARDSPLVFESAGRRQLKGFDDPVLVYSVLADSDARKLAGE